MKAAIATTLIWGALLATANASPQALEELAASTSDSKPVAAADAKLQCVHEQMPGNYGMRRICLPPGMWAKLSVADRALLVRTRVPVQIEATYTASTNQSAVSHIETLTAFPSGNRLSTRQDRDNEVALSLRQGD
ncbi:hypothetical protein [Cognatilysobacter terrigena]|uniref:hypothetical protein n=1 Tax=Cognatilysobacter terrigena TaxID=2488749 RepID=UPI00105EC940|nr:hypothetical protein [Lysobacter terrigena]